MKKVIKKYGNSNVIILDAEDMHIYGLKVGDIIDVEISNSQKKEVKKNGRSTKNR